ncbi:MAG: cell division protein ZapB [Acidobacteria bacterium]|nr:cell division protein ZapB [Acidobacteriota bacterium]TDI22310.1 MAG: cell division protein ZapB [Acidobacteriota bacterium]
MVKTTSSVGLEPFDRLADKVQSLVGVLERTRAELTRTAEDNARLSREVDALRTQLATAEGQGAQAQSLRAERDQIRTRVTEMLEQLEGLSL